jgi:hypothetical protein
VCLQQYGKDLWAIQLVGVKFLNLEESKSERSGNDGMKEGVRVGEKMSVKDIAIIKVV